MLGYLTQPEQFLNSFKEKKMRNYYTSQHIENASKATSKILCSQIFPMHLMKYFSLSNQ